VSKAADPDEDQEQAAPTTREGHKAAVEREFLANALYLGIVLYAALAVVPSEDLPSDHDLVLLILGTGVGLILAHWFAFHVAAAAVSPEGRRQDHESEEAGAQVAGGLTVAVLGALLFAFFDGERAVHVTQFLLGMLPAVAGYVIGRHRGHSRLLSGLVAAAVLVVASLITVLKISLIH